MASKESMGGIVILLAIVLAAASMGAGSTSASSLTVESVPLITHLQFGVFEMDGFIDRGDGKGVYRATANDADNPLMANTVLYITATATPHDPTFSNEGPFPKGSSTGVKLSDWLSARGSVAYACQNGKATFDSSFSNLVPNGVYTLWYARLAMENGQITDVKEYPLGASDGSQNTFLPDGNGNARFHLANFGCVEPTSLDSQSTGVATVFAAAWHSDGKTYGSSPGDFGSKTHVQLFAIAAAAKG